MIDCHCHLVSPEFDDDVDQVIERAKAAGVSKAIVCAEFRSQFEKILVLAQRHPDFVRPALGIHPIQFGDSSVTEEDFSDTDEFIRLAAADDKLVAIGEVGLDFTMRYSPTDVKKEVQREILKRQIALSNELNLPLNVHSRNAGRPTIRFLLENGAKKVQMHAYNGNVKSAKPGIEAGFYFSFPPSSILGDQKPELATAVPLEQILLETDSPVLGPLPNERNEPANLRVSAEFIAKVKGISVEEVIAKTTENAYRLYSSL